MAVRRRPTYSNRRTRGRHESSNLPYIFGAVIAVGLMVAAFLWMNRTASELAVDETTLCPASTAPLGETVILFDLTDPLSVAQSNQLKQYLENEFASAPVGTQFTMGVVSENEADWGATSPLCKPISAKDVSNLTQNVGLVEKRYKERFLAPMEANLNNMIAASGANTSPIMESLQALVADTPNFLTATTPRQIILISDLLQHSEAMSFYRGDDWQTFQASTAFQRLGRNLDRVDIKIYAVARDTARIKDPAAVEDFWLRYFELQGANLPTLYSLGDL